MTTAQLDAMAEDYIRKAGARPSFKGYKGFPASICVSIDDEVVHGIPGDRVIEEGQVVSIDAGAIWQGYHGDGARTFYVGHAAGRRGPAHRHDAPGPDGRHRGRGPRRARRGRLRARSRTWRSKAGATSSGRSSATASARRCTRTCRSPTTGPAVAARQLEPGICIAIEPMLALGSADVETLADGWTVVTTDHSLAAHFEHTIAVTESGPVILTTA